MEEKRGEIKSYVLRSGRMTELQRKAYAELARFHSIPFEPGRPGLSSPAAFENDKPLVVEIGFGMGFATKAIAQAKGEWNFVGIEVHKPGVGKLLHEIEAMKLDNLKIVEHDAVETIEEMAEDGAIAGFNIFFPDPWPKKRHHKRRLLKADFAGLLARKLVPGGFIYFVTDWEEYAQEALGTLSACPGLANAYPGFADRQTWRPLTKFEIRAEKEGRKVRELYFVKGKIGMAPGAAI
jgi:tRNA (guanine-N7-)-methyltransferase